MQVFVIINKDGIIINLEKCRDVENELRSELRIKCREKLNYKEKWNKGFIWNPSNCNCECDKSCDVGEYLDYENCKCRRKIVGSLVEECSKNIDENEMTYNETLNVSLIDFKCGSCAQYTALFVVFFITSIFISAVFIYFYWHLDILIQKIVHIFFIV